MSLWLTRGLLNPNSRLQLLDHPNPRSLHDSPKPRGGGLAIFLAVAVSGFIAVGIDPASIDLVWIAGAAFLVAGISFIDDWLSLHLSHRIVVHFAAAGLLMWAGLDLKNIVVPGSVWTLPEALAIGFSLLFIVWMVNLYNFMDGMDGFAAGMAVIGFGSFAIFGWLANESVFAMLSLIVAAAAGGFLISNFPPARIFMGDVGSSLLGLLATAFMLWADRDGIFPLWIGVLIFSPFIADATVTLIRRMLRRERFWEAHKSHYYQRLVQLGWGHRRTVLWEYAVMLLCALSALGARYLDAAGQWVVIAGWLLVYLSVMLIVHRLEMRHEMLVTR
jgi:UDP-N-acetylmuramyl pentapeptide phosphotransferase/UDP-N-acetylglucosamine-1-phosphate transferase